MKRLSARRKKPPGKPDIEAAEAERKASRQALREARALDQSRARADVLARIEAYREQHNLSRNAAVAALVKAVAAAAVSKQPVRVVQVEGFDLPYHVVGAARGWNGRGVRVALSRRTIYDWIRAQSSIGEAEPPQSRPVARLEKGASQEFSNAFRFIETAPQSLLELLLTRLEPGAVDRIAAALRRLRP